MASAIIVGPCLLGLVLRFGAPFFGTMAVAFVAQYRVFGPITKQSLLPGPNVRPYHENIWTAGLTAAYCLALLHLPLQDELPRTLHRYYARALRRNFFDQGSDAPLAALSKDVAGGVAPPNLRESGATRPRTGRGAPRAARGGARRGDAAEVEPRGGAHHSEACGAIGVRGLPVAIIPVLRALFYS